MNKICTSKEQSQKLIDLGIDVITADMDYVPFANNPKEYDCIVNVWNNKHEKDWIPAWSLSALLNVLPYPSLHSTFMGWRCDSYNKEGTTCSFGECTDNPIDTVFEMVVRLKENNKM